MAIYDFFLSRNNGVSGANYVGHAGRLFYDSNDGLFRLSDGVTPGGRVVANLSIATSQTTPPPLPRVGELWYNPSNNELLAYYNGGWQSTINLATPTTIGGIKLGPGVTVDGQGRLIIDTGGLEFSFGDFYAYNDSGTDSTTAAWLSSINPNEDIVIASNGTGSVNTVGEFNVYAADGALTDRNPNFKVSADGQVTIYVPATDPAEGAVSIIGSLSGAEQSPVNSGVMLHITGNNNDASRIYNDSIASFAAFVARRYNGNATVPTAVLDGEEIMRLSGTAHNGTSIPGTANQRITFKAVGNQTLTNQGGLMEFAVTPQNSTTLTKIATIDSTGFVLESGKVLTGNVTGTADIATTVTLVATNTTNATHYLTFVDSATGNENVRTDTSLTYNPSTNILSTGTVSATTGTFTNFTGKFIRNTRDAGTIGAGGTLTIDFTTDAIVYCVWGDGMTLAYQNYLAGSVVKVIARKSAGTGNDPINLDGVTAAQVSTGSTTTPNYSANTTAFIELTCTGTTIGSVYVKL